MSAPMVLTAPCTKRRDEKHVFDRAASDMAVLTSFAADADRGAVVRLSRCRACGMSLVSVAAHDSEDDDLGIVLTVLGLEVGE